MLGNRPRISYDPNEAFSWGSPSNGFRVAKRGAGGGGLWMAADRVNFWDTVTLWDEKYGRGSYVIDDRVPDTEQTLQGEIARTTRGLEGYLGSSHLPMRVAAAQGILQHRSPATTLALINYFMDPSSRDDVDAIWDLFPDAVIEFTCFSCSVGIFHRNTIFWEVRNY